MDFSRKYSTIEIILENNYVYYQFRFVRRADLFPLQLGKVYGFKERLVSDLTMKAL